MGENHNRQRHERLPEGRMIDRFRVGSHIGSGGYGDIYTVYDTDNDDRLCAMKVEYLNAEKQALLEEISIMMKLQKTYYFPELIFDGVMDDFRFLVMELLGPSLSTMRRALTDHHFTLDTTLKLSLEMLKSIEEFHRRGFIHRDIKPGNFLIRPNRDYPICLIDFGLSQPYLNQTSHEHIPPRKCVGFTGTCRYASVHAHEEKQLSRRDDLFSWFYSLLELIESKVPWPGSRDRELTFRMKTETTVKELCHSFPSEFQEIYMHIKRLGFKETPNYKKIKRLLKKSINNIKSHDPRYDWEFLEKTRIQEISSIPLEFNEEITVTAGCSNSKRDAEGGCATCSIA